jgi:electron transfer flavoprotein alpha subunit
MGARFWVTAATVAELQRMAAAARRLTAGDGVVDAVDVEENGTLLAPEGVTVDELAAQLGGLVDTLLVYGSAGSWLRGDVWAAALDDALGEGADGVFLADAPAAREAAGRLAAARGASCASMCDEVALAADGTFTARRAIYGGVAEGTLSLAVTPVVCLFAAGKFDGAADGAAVAVERLQVQAPPAEITHIGDEPVVKTVDLAGASIVISVGRGFARADDLDLVKPIVQALGAELGCSRPIAEDFKWLPKERLVGLTGTSVNADLYVALGISGQVQHLTGIKGARTVVAVNNDSKAPIVRNADYIIVDDLYKVIPALVAALDGAARLA